MKKIMLIITSVLLLFTLAACKDTATPYIPTPDVSPSAEPSAEPNENVIQFTFTEENFPIINGSLANRPYAEAVKSVLLGLPRDECAMTFVSRSSEAYTVLKDGEADLLIVYEGSEDIKAEIDFEKEFLMTSIGRDALVFIVNVDNPVDNLTTEEVQKIFSGEISNWSEVGGTDEAIRAYQRPEASGSQTLMRALVMGDIEMAQPETLPVVAEMGGLIDAVAEYSGGPTGIGYNVYYFVTEMVGNPNVKLVSIDGVLPSYETIQSGEYPFVNDYYAAIRIDEPKDSPAHILYNWLQGEDAQRLLKNENYVPVMNIED